MTFLATLFQQVVKEYRVYNGIVAEVKGSCHFLDYTEKFYQKSRRNKGKIITNYCKSQ